MVWRITGRGGESRLVGTPHLFPYRFRGAIERLLAPARDILIEGPLDPPSMRQVVDAGSKGVHVSLYHTLDAATRRRIYRDFGLAPGFDAKTSNVFFGRPDEWLADELRTLKPWLAFFGLWTRFHEREGGRFSLDLDAYRGAAEMGKPVHCLETIEEQIAALEAIPLERIVHFLEHVDWPAYYADYVRHYLKGDIDGLMAVAQVFPSICEAVIGERDALLAERLAPALERGNACVFIGVTHCPGVLARLHAGGFESARASPP